MKKLLLFMFAIVAFAACEQAPIEEQSAVRQDAPETITVGFEGDDTRIQLNEAQKTVWTKGDLVSVFYRSNANQQWKYDGETGARTAELKRVDAGNATETMKRVVVVYPYNGNYYINTETYNVQASLPAVQNYLKDSYGTNGNIMISSSEYNQFSLKSVCGWLKLQLTGDGETIKSIKFRGNDGEQVAGELYINSADATAALASDMGDADDNNAGGSLVFDDTILKEVTLDCGEGVVLGAEATAFYIALPPQTFEEGFTVDIECDGYIPMTLSTTNTLTIERNHIQPMASVEHNATPIVPNNQIWYTSSDGNVVTPKHNDVFGATIISNTYNNGKGVITFDGDVTTIGNYAFAWCDSLTSVNIPDSVTSIGEAVFFDCYRLTSVNIPDSVTTIGEGAFAGCDSLKEFKGKYATEDGRSLIVDNTIIAYANASGNTYNIPDCVTTIGSDAFYFCNSLTSVNIPDSVTTIGENAFAYCNSLTSVNIPDSVTEIGEYAFYYCYRLTSVNIPDSVTSIGESAFFYCESLTSVNIPDSVTTIGEGAFASCTSLTSVNIPDSVTEIGEYAFMACESLTSVNIPDSVTTIGSCAFEYCISLTSVNIPDSVTEIGDNAFCNCISLTSVNIPDSVTTIGTGAFDGCESLTSVYCKATTPPALGGTYVFDVNGSGRKIYVPAGSVNAYKSAYGWSEYADCIVGYNFATGVVVEEQPYNEIWYTSSDGNIVTPNKTNVFGATIISNEYNNGMGVITFDGDVTTIGNSAFYSRKSLTSVNIPDSVTTIGVGAFYECTSLTSVNIPDSVTSIGGLAFNYCTSLTSVNIPDSVTEIGWGAFYNCNSLTSVYCKATTPPALGYTDIFDANDSGRKIYVPAESVDAYKSAEYWSEYADAIVGYDFGDSGLVTPEIDDSCKIHYTATSKVTPYDTSAFNVEILSNEWDSTTGEGVITFNGVVETIDSYAFYMCSNLKSVRIPEQVTSIGAGAFRECIKLNDVYFNSKIESIGSGAFTACFDIYNSTYGSINIHLNSIEDWCEISMPVSLVSAQETIYLKINGSTTSDITIPTTIKAIKPYAFRRCAVSSVTLHEEVASIGDKAFYDSWLKNLYCKPTTPPTGGSEMFEETSNLTIYTPTESVDAYKSATGWSDYKYAITGYDFENGVVVE